MNLQHRIFLLHRLGEYMLFDTSEWKAIKSKAAQENNWFIPEFIDHASRNIAQSFLKNDILENWANIYQLQATNSEPRIVGIVMAGNIPLVGFHDFLCVFISGHKAVIKLSSKDRTLLKHLVGKLGEWDKEVKELVQFADLLKGCEVYIATGSNNSYRYFDYYFSKYPHIIRRNKTSVAVLNGKETKEELERLADDVYLYFGLGCRNITKIYVPVKYDFLPMLTAFKKYNYLADHHKFKNNYDYNLALHMLNKKYYMTNLSLLLIEESSIFSPIAQLNYEFYNNKKEFYSKLESMDDIQCIIGKDFIPFGQAQNPPIDDYADGVNTMKFLTSL